MAVFKIVFMSGRVEFITAYNFNVVDGTYVFWESDNPIVNTRVLTATQMHVETIEGVVPDERDTK